MERLTRDASVAFVGVAAVVLMALPAAAQSRGASSLQAPGRLQARAVSGTITGTVMDESGTALPGAMVSVLGVTLASTVTDERGQFALNQLPLGDYLLRAHMLGFAASTGSMIRVGISTTFQRVQLRRLDGAVATSGTGEAPVKARPIIAAGFELPRGGDSTSSASPSSEHPHDDASWWTRHLKRSILKDSSQLVVLTDDDTLPSNGSLFGRAMGSAASVASSLFTDFPFSGEVNFLTTGSVAPGALLSATALPRGVAYLALAAPGAGGDWSIRAAMSEGDLSSWIVAGAFASKTTTGPHRYDLGLSYSTQEYLGGNPAALAAVTDGSRNVGELYAFDEWTLSPKLTVEYGARYAHYDYLQQRGLLSPRFGVGVEAFPETTVRVGDRAAHGRAGRRRVPDHQRARPVASTRAHVRAAWRPGGRAPRRARPLLRRRSRPSAWRRVRRRRRPLPPVGRRSARDDLRAVDAGRPAVSRPLLRRQRRGGRGGRVGGALEYRRPTRALQGSVQYSRTEARWIGRGIAGSAADQRGRGHSPRHRGSPRPHDFADRRHPRNRDARLRPHKINNGFVSPGLASPSTTGLDGRFGLQVNQALPVAFAGTKWEVLVGLRNLFRDPTGSGIGVRRTAGRPPTQAAGRRFPGPILENARV